MSKHKKKKVSFLATKRIPVKVKVSFKTSKGKKVSFTATKRVPKKVRVTFYASTEKSKKKRQ